MSYINHQDAGKRLAQALRHFKDKGAMVLALPRGGIVLGSEVAKEFKAPLGLVMVRKIEHLSYSEYAIGALVEEEKPIYNEAEVASTKGDWLNQAESTAREEKGLEPVRRK